MEHTCSCCDVSQQPTTASTATAVGKCTNCIKAASKRCSRCKAAWYCSVECQVIDWPRHKGLCKVPVADKETRSKPEPPPAPAAAASTSSVPAKVSTRASPISDAIQLLYPFVTEAKLKELMTAGDTQTIYELINAALAYDDMEKLDMLIRSGIDINGDQIHNPLTYASILKNGRAFTRLLNVENIDTNRPFLSKGGRVETPLGVACKLLDAYYVDMLLENKADANIDVRVARRVKVKHPKSADSAAAASASAAASSSAAAEPEEKDTIEEMEMNMPPLILALSASVQADETMNSDEMWKETQLTRVSSAHKIVDLLLKHKVNPNVRIPNAHTYKDIGGTPALYIALQTHAVLVEMGCAPPCFIRPFETPQNVAPWRDQTCNNLEDATKQQYTPWWLKFAMRSRTAADEHVSNMVTQLLEAGADPNIDYKIDGRRNNTAPLLILCAGSADLLGVSHLLFYNATPCARSTPSKFTALMTVCDILKDIYAARVLMNNASETVSSTDHRSLEERTLERSQLANKLVKDACRRRMCIMLMLLGANIDYKLDATYAEPVSESAETTPELLSSNEIKRGLEKQKDKLCVLTEMPTTISRDATRIIRLYNYVNATDVEGNTALHYATTWGFLDGVDILLNNGANPTLRNNSGFTAMDYSVKNDIEHHMTTMTRALLQSQYGAEIRASNPDGLGALLEIIELEDRAVPKDVPCAAEQKDGTQEECHPDPILETMPPVVGHNVVRRSPNSEALCPLERSAFDAIVKRALHLPYPTASTAPPANAPSTASVVAPVQDDVKATQ